MNPVDFEKEKKPKRRQIHRVYFLQNIADTNDSLGPYYTMQECANGWGCHLSTINAIIYGKRMNLLINKKTKCIYKLVVFEKDKSVPLQEEQPEDKPIDAKSETAGETSDSAANASIVDEHV